MKRTYKIFPSLFFILLSLASYSQDTLSVEDAVRVALENNYTIQLVKNDVAIAENNNNIYNAGFLPSVIASGSQDNSINSVRQRQISGLERSVDNGVGRSINGSVMMDWTIFQGFNMFIAKNTLEQLQGVEEMQARITIENAVSSVIVAYFEIVAGQMRRRVLLDAVSLSKERKDLAEFKLKLGSASQIDLYQATVDLNADSSALLQQEAVLKALKADLNLLLGRDPATAFEVVEVLPLNTDINFASTLEKVKNQNSQIFLARRNLTLAELNTQYWKNQYFPSISLYGGYNYVRSENPSSIFVFNKTYGPVYGVRASFNIFNGFANKRNLANARIMQKSGELQLKQAQLEVENDFYKVYTSYETSHQLLKLEEANVKVARENFNIASEKFKLGAIDNIELRVTQQKLIDAENRFVNAQYQAKIAETEIYRLSGVLWGL
ncbi:MAG TPA: TolC family protein [Cytophagaceae bacterium]